MITILENTNVKLKVNSLGAELQSFFNKETGIEHIWQANPEFWPRHAPVLFPIVGKVKNNLYHMNQKQYELSQHGFARDNEFELIHQTKESLKYAFNATRSTLEKYPFEFLLTIEYKLNNNKLTTTYEVVNKDKVNMFFSIGAHPGFTCPFFNNEKYEDYSLLFEANETADRILLTPNGLRSGKKSQNFLNNQNTIQLTPHIFHNDAIIFESLKSKQITLQSKNHNHQLHFSWDNFPYLGIWAKPGASFVCLEPWNGIADMEGEKSEFNFKKGILELEPSTDFKCHYAMASN